MKVKTISEWIVSDVPEPHKHHLLRLNSLMQKDNRGDEQRFITFTGAITSLNHWVLRTYSDGLSPEAVDYLKKVMATANPALSPGMRDWSFSDEHVRPKEPAPVAVTTHTDKDSGVSQCKKIYKHMLKKGSISQMEATELYRITRLAGRIADLKKAGHNIQTEMVRFGKFGRYARYSLAKEGA